MAKADMAKVVSIIGDRLIDAVSIVALIIFVLYAELDVHIAVTVIAIIAGVNLAHLMNKGGSVPPGTAGVVTMIASGVVEAARRSKGMMLPVVFSWLLVTIPSGCASAAYAPVLAQTIEVVAEIVKKETGQDLADLPTICEHETEKSATVHKLHLMCEVDLSGVE